MILSDYTHGPPTIVLTLTYFCFLIGPSFRPARGFFFCQQPFDFAAGGNHPCSSDVPDRDAARCTRASPFRSRDPLSLLQLRLHLP